MELHKVNQERALPPAVDTTWHHSIQNLSLKTEFHGLSDLYKAPNSKEMIFWALVLLLSSIFLAIELAYVIDDYQQHPILTTYAIVADPEQLQFPEIYLCPSNPIHAKSWQDSRVEEQWESKNVQGLFKVHQNHSDLEGILAQKSTISESLARFYAKSGSAPPSPPIFTDDWIPADVQEYFMKVGYPTDAFLKECAFNSEAIECESLAEPILDGDYGKCFLLKSSQFHQNVAGLGLSIVLDLDTLGSFFDGKFEPPLFDGVVMKIGEKLDIGSQYKILLHPGTYTKVSLDATKMNLMEKIRKSAGQKCIDSKDFRFKALNTTYTPGSCQLDCVHALVHEHCDCHMMLDKRFLQNTTEKPFCTPAQLNNCTYPTILKHRETIKNCSKGCHVPCNFWQYTVDTSTARFPSTSQIISASENQVQDQLQKADYIILDVAFSSLQFIEVTQKSSMTINTFISNIGGQLGLWVGASAVTLIKCCVFLSPLCCIFCAKTRPASTQTEHTVRNNH